MNVNAENNNAMNVNAITVNIPDKQTPIVIFFGAPRTGKTVVLIRMVRFLEYNDYTVVPEENFSPSEIRDYARSCADFRDKVYAINYRKHAIDYYTFMLVKVYDKVGHPICQILKVPGVYYFDGTTDLNFPKYINDIRTSPNRKVWVFFVEQGWGENQGERNLYAQKIRRMQNLISPNDKVVFLFNKADLERETQFNRNGKPILSTFFANISQQYPGIFDKYKNTGLMKLFYGQYNFKAVCFSSGTFYHTNSGRTLWFQENDWYCSELWKVIK